MNDTDYVIDCYETKAYALMVNNSTNISKTNNHSLFNSLNTVKDHAI